MKRIGAKKKRYSKYLLVVHVHVVGITLKDLTQHHRLRYHLNHRKCHI